MTHVTCRLTAKNRDQLRNPTLGNRVWATFLRDFYCRHPSLYSLHVVASTNSHRVDMRPASSTVNCYDVFVSIAPLFTLTLQQQQPVNRQCTVYCRDLRIGRLRSNRIRNESGVTIRIRIESRIESAVYDISTNIKFSNQ